MPTDAQNAVTFEANQFAIATLEEGAINRPPLLGHYISDQVNFTRTVADADMAAVSGGVHDSFSIGYELDNNPTINAEAVNALETIVNDDTINLIPASLKTADLALLQQWGVTMMATPSKPVESMSPLSAPGTNHQGPLLSLSHGHGI